MTVTLEIAPELEAALRTMAQRAGVEPDRYIARALQEHVQRRQNEPPHLLRKEAVRELDALREELSPGMARRRTMPTWCAIIDRDEGSGRRR